MPEKASLDRARRVNAACERYEADWRAGRRPRIEDELDRAREPDRPPFGAATVMETLVRVLEEDPMPPSRLRPGVPPELEAICLKCLEKDPAGRYASAEDLAADLERFLRGEGVVAMRAGPWLRLRRWTRREPQLVARLIGLVVIEALAQLNYATDPLHDLRSHLGVTGALAAWALASVALQAIARRDRRRDAVPPAWAAVDVALLTLILRLLDAVDDSMVVGLLKSIHKHMY